MDKILELKNINGAYDQARVLFDVSLCFESNKTSIIVGKNGAGKTTLFRIIAGFMKPTSGSVNFFNNKKSQSLIGVAPHKIANLGIRYVAQDKAVFSDLTVRENLELAAYPTKDYNWDFIFEYFPKLKALLNRKAGYLSGGERQMLMIGRALLGKPRLLLLDEPMEGLAPVIVEGFIEVISKLKEELTLVIVEQNLPVISLLADRVFAIKEGKIVAEINNKDDIKKANFESYL